MNHKLLITISIGLVLILITFLIPSTVFASQPVKVDKETPVFAKDIELAKKVQIKGDKGSAKPPKTTPSAATGILGQSQPVSGDKYAIVIGISDYPGTVNDLNYCDDDARDMVEALESYSGFSAGNITTFIDVENTGATNATRSDIIAKIQSLAATVSADDEVVFFYSGHGGRGKASDGDTEVTDECIWVHDGSKLVPIWDGELESAFRNYATSRIIFVFDSCYAGGMTDLNKDGRIVAMASTETTLSYEISSLANGEFTYYMIDKGIVEGSADKYDSINGRSDTTIEEAWDYAKLNCRSDSITLSDSFEKDLLP
jgi:metacaspase-1